MSIDRKISVEEIAERVEELEVILKELSKRQVELVDAFVRGKIYSDNEKPMAQVLYECKLEIEECESQIEELKKELNKKTKVR